MSAIRIAALLYVHLWRRMAGYVDKVLRGVNPAELPVSSSRRSSS